jgi:hypothetical protein
VKSIASSIQCAFENLTEEEDAFKYREALKTFIESNNRETMSAIAENLDTTLLTYCNKHAVKVHAPLLGGPPKEQPPQEPLSLKKGANGALKLPLSGTAK